LSLSSSVVNKEQVAALNYWVCNQFIYSSSSRSSTPSNFVSPSSPTVDFSIHGSHDGNYCKSEVVRAVFLPCGNYSELGVDKAVLTSGNYSESKEAKADSFTKNGLSPSV